MELKEEFTIQHKVYRISIASLWVVGSDIIAYKADKGADDNLKDAHEWKEAVQTIAKENHMQLPIGMYVDITDVASLSRESRDFYANASDVIKAAAILAQSNMAKILGNFFVNLRGSKYPAKVFSDGKEAMKWLKTQVS